MSYEAQPWMKAFARLLIAPFVREKSTGKFDLQTTGRAGIQYPQMDMGSALDASRIEVWAFACLNVIGKQLSSVPMIVRRRKTIDGKRKWVEDDFGPEVDIVARPNPSEAGFVLQWKLAMSLLAVGKGYVEIDPLAKELYHVKASLVRPVVNVSGRIVSYEITKSGTTMSVPVENIVDITLPTPSSEYFGQSAIEVITPALTLNYYHRRYLRKFFERGAIPAGILTSDLPSFNDQMSGGQTKDNASALSQQFNDEHQGVDKFFNLLKVSGGYKYQQVTPNLRDLVVDTIAKMSREEICAAFGVPPSTVGILEYANYANMDAQERFLWRHTILPLMRVISGAFTVQLLPRLIKNHAEVEYIYDIANVSALKEDETVKANNLTRLVSTGIITVNEAREELGRQPIEGADDLREPSLGFGQLPTETSMGTDIDSGDTEKGITVKHTRSAKTSPDHERVAKWRSHDATLTNHTRKAKSAVRAYWNGQLDRVLAKLNNRSVGGQYLSLIYGKRDPKYAGDLFDPAEEDKILREAMADVFKGSVSAGGKDKLKQMGIDLSFNVDNPAVQKTIESMLKRITYINDQTWRDVQSVLIDAQDNGWGIGEIEKQLRDVYSGWSKGRAELVARTEMNGAVNGGGMDALRQLSSETGKEVRKVWLATQDEFTRIEHADADGQEVAMNEDFTVGGESMANPGDPRGSAANNCNCRCTFEGVLVD